MVLAGLLSLGLCSFVIAKFTEDDSADRFTTEAVLLNMADAALASGPPEVFDPGAAPGAEERASSRAPATPIYREKQAQVKPGDNLAVIFQREGIAARELQRLLASKPLGPRLRSIFPGHKFTFTLTEDQTLVKLAYSPGPLEALEFERVGEVFVGREVTQEPERTTAYTHATIDHSLFVASQRAGLDDALTMRLAQIFQ